jgi:DNA end-binding protein Ku
MRPIWSGTINFGLVSVPVRMFSATQSKELRFNFVHKGVPARERTLAR